MNDIPLENLDFDGGVFIDNVNNFPRKELEKFAGRRVAWSLDGKRILASGQDDEEVDTKLRAAGISPSQVVHAIVEPLDGVAHL